MIRVALITAVLMAVPAAVLAAEPVQQPASEAIPAPPPPPPNVRAKTDADKVICETQYETGSRLMHHIVCLTRAQWNQYQAENREHLQRMEQLGESGGG